MEERERGEGSRVGDGVRLHERTIEKEKLRKRERKRERERENKRKRSKRMSMGGREGNPERKSARNVKTTSVRD